MQDGLSKGVCHRRGGQNPGDEIDFLLSECEGLDAENLMRDRVLSRACIRSLEIIGEAVKNVSNELKERHPKIEWRLTCSS